MAAYVNKIYSERFFIKEENLLKIADIIKKRMAELEEFSLFFTIYRKDDFFVRYDDVGQVLKEENSKRNAIIRLVIGFESKNTSGYVNFDTEDESILKLESEDRDLAFLLASDLKEYLKSEVFVHSRNYLKEAIDSDIFFPITAISGLLLGLFIISSNSISETPASIIASHSIEQKINYILKSDKSHISGFSFFLPLIISIAIGLLLPFSLKFFDRLSLTNTFYWGKEVEAYEKKKSLRDKVIWGIAVSLLVAIAGAYLYDKLKLPK